MRKHSKQPLSKLKEKVDRACQDYYRRTYAGHPSEVSAKPFEVMHHYIPKSQSAGLRYEPINLTFITHAEHFAHHQKGDPSIHDAIRTGRGEEWLKELNRLKIERKGFQLDRQFLEQQLTRFQ